MTIRELLRSVQLENLAESIEKENITPEILKDLTDADLRELDVASMAGGLCGWVVNLTAANKAVS